MGFIKRVLFSEASYTIKSAVTSVFSRLTLPQLKRLLGQLIKPLVNFSKN